MVCIFAIVSYSYLLYKIHTGLINRTVGYMVYITNRFFFQAFKLAPADI